MKHNASSISNEQTALRQAGTVPAPCMRLFQCLVFSPKGKKRAAANCFSSGMSVAILLLLAGAAYANPLGLSMMRYHDDVYRPGAPVEIMVTVSAFGEGAPNALGIYEILPEGWRFSSVYGAAAPPVHPVPGTLGSLEFAWITPPPLPFEFFYTVAAPEGAWGVQEIRGVLEYRVAGGAHYLPELITVLYGPEEQAPTITLHGEAFMTLVQGDLWQEPGYTALSVDGQDISSRVVVSGEVQPDRIGAYRIRYSIASESGRQSAEAARVVEVVDREQAAAEEAAADTDAPPFNEGFDSRRQRPTPVNIPGTSERGETQTDLQQARQQLREKFSFPDISMFRPGAAGADDAAEAEEQEVEAKSVRAAGPQGDFREREKEEVEKTAEEARLDAVTLELAPRQGVRRNDKQEPSSSTGHSRVWLRRWAFVAAIGLAVGARYVWAPVKRRKRGKRKDRRE